MDFETGVERLTELLEDLGWPTALVWVRHDQVLYRSFLGTAVFRPLPDTDAEQHARAVFNERYGHAAGVMFYGVGHDAGRTYALVEAIEEPFPGEAENLIEDGLQIGVRNEGHRTQVIRSPLFWLIMRALHLRWETTTVRT